MLGRLSDQQGEMSGGMFWGDVQGKCPEGIVADRIFWTYMYNYSSLLAVLHRKNLDIFQNFKRQFWSFNINPGLAYSGSVLHTRVFDETAAKKRSHSSNVGLH